VSAAPSGSAGHAPGATRGLGVRRRSPRVGTAPTAGGGPTTPPPPLLPFRPAAAARFPPPQKKNGAHPTTSGGATRHACAGGGADCTRAPDRRGGRHPHPTKGAPARPRRQAAPRAAADRAERILQSVVHRSPLHTARLSYRPRTPPLLRGCFQVIEGDATTAESDADTIRGLFPVLYGQPTVTLVPNRGTPVTMGNGLRVGFVLSGGPASGGHNVISGLYDHLLERNMDSKVFGFIDGPSGICTGTYIEVTAELVDAFRNQGGFHMVGSGRTKIHSPEQFAQARATAEKLQLDGLVVIGGDDSNTNAMLLAEDFAANGLKTRVIGCPKTIDGDLVRCGGCHAEVGGAPPWPYEDA